MDMLYHMVMLRSQNIITDFFMILAWACPFKIVNFLNSGAVGPVTLGFILTTMTTTK